MIDATSKSIENERFNQIMELFNQASHKSLKSEQAFANALTMLVALSNWQGNIRHLFDALPSAQDRELDLLDVLNTMANLGFVSNRREVDAQTINQCSLPCLFIPADQFDYPPLVITNIVNNLMIAFHSTENREVQIPLDQIQGLAYSFKQLQPEELQEQQQIESAAGISWFTSIFNKFRPVIHQIVITSLFINLFSLAMPLFSILVYNRIIGAGSIYALRNIVAGILLAIAAECILRIFRLKTMAWLGTRLDNIVSNAIFAKLLFIKASYTEGASLSAQIARLKAFRSIREFLTSASFVTIVELPFTIIILLIIWLISGPLVLVPLAMIILFTILLIYFNPKIRLRTSAAARANADLQLLNIELCIKMPFLRASGVSRVLGDRFQDKAVKAAKANFESSFIISIMENVVHAMAMTSGIVIIVCGTHLLWNGTLTIGALVATMILIWRVLTPLQTLCSMLPRFQQVQNIIWQINKLINIEAEYRPVELKQIEQPFEGQVTFNNVGLRYNLETEPVFVGLEIKTQPGEVIGLFGPNGVGKTSILKLINGLYQPQTGIISIDGLNIRQINPIDLRQRITYLPQRPDLLAGTVRENLLLANPYATNEMLDGVMQQLGPLAKNIHHMTEGLETLIHANSQLPVEILHTIALGRILLQTNNHLLLLDELLTSDQQINALYHQIIERAKGKSTVFFVSKQKAHLKLADKIILLEAGGRPLIISGDKFLQQYRHPND